MQKVRAPSSLESDKEKPGYLQEPGFLFRLRIRFEPQSRSPLARAEVYGGADGDVGKPNYIK